MRVMYRTETNANEEGGKSFEKIIEVKAITFYDLTREIQIGSRYYEIPDEIDFDDLKFNALSNGFIDVTSFSFTSDQPNNYGRNGRRNQYNNGGYGNNRRRYSR